MTEPAGSEGPSSVTSAGDQTIVGSRFGDHSIFNFGRVRDGDPLPLVVLLPLLAVVAVAVRAVLSWPGGPQGQYVLFYLTLAPAFLLAVLCVVGGTVARSAARPAPAALPGRPSRAALLLLASALLLSLLALAGLEDVRRNGQVSVAIDVLGTQSLVSTENGDVRGTWTLMVPASAPARDRLRLRLTVADHDPTVPTCVHHTTVVLTTATAGVTPNAQRVSAESVTEFDIRGSGGAVAFDVTLKTGPNCALRIAQVSGTLYND
ncbi:hypothetical protein ACIRBX_25535 [Kitasatospora sp. NPDC096147]|uniref:hypothetical protein n=1 Tax=Kitasatospora sp. NPDC096147 TaxID=3364093 RepID=UPI0038040E0F